MASVRDTKGSAFSCEQCRKRKVKCDGREPLCRRCETRGDECIYRQQPTRAYTQQLESRIKQLEAEVAALRGGGPTAAPVAAAATTTPAAGPTRGAAEAPEASAVPVGDFRGLKLDNQGVTTYHGATSFFHLLDDSRPAARMAGPDGDGPVGAEMRQRLVLNAWHQRELENVAQIPEPFQYLLNTHWCWVQPLFNFIYRPAFTRDMTVMGPYYSHTLMNAVLSHSVRWAQSSSRQVRALLQPYEGGAVFARHARTMILDELRLGICTIPTVQTLLLLSAQECSLGHSAQAWVYSGVAFRLIDHLGICFDGQRYSGSVKLSDEDVEIRRRLFWSCYFWDKIISLYLGRSPSLRESLVSPPQRMLDDSAEEELWLPHGMAFPPGHDYPPTKAHSTSSFVQICKLSVIFNQILIHLYDPLQHSTDAEIRNCVDEQGRALNHWWHELPAFLKIEPQALPLLSPPSHVVTLNCLYHAFRILMYRPMLSHRFSRTKAIPEPIPEPSPEPNLSHLLECVTSATAIVAIFDLFCRTFRESPCVLSLNYSVYIAASIFLLQVQASINDQQALRCLEFCIQALQRARAVNPIIGSALDLITKATGDLGLHVSGVSVLPEELMGTEPQPQHQAKAAAAATGPASVSSPPSFLPGTSHPLRTHSFSGVPPNPAWQSVQLENWGQMLDISPEMFEAVSSLEPMPAGVGALDEYNRP